VASAEPRDGHVVGGLIAGKHPEGDVLLAAARKLPGGAHAKAVAIEQEAEHGLGVGGGMAVPIIPVGSVEGVEVDLVDDVEDEPGEMVVGEPVAQVGGQQERLVAVTAQEVIGHAPF
jgi:hypothetical protein